MTNLTIEVLANGLRDARTKAVNERNADLATYGLWPENQWRPSAEHDVAALIETAKAHGYVLAPVEATEEMLATVIPRPAHWPSDGPDVPAMSAAVIADRFAAASLYRDLLSASPPVQ